MTKRRIFLLIILIFSLQIISLISRSFFDVSLNQSLFFGYLGNNIVGICVSIFLLLLLSIFCFRGYIQTTVYILVSGGAVSNLIDRISYGGVVDYIKFFNLPSFNFADLVIIFGALLLFWNELQAKNVKHPPIP